MSWINFKIIIFFIVFICVLSFLINRYVFGHNKIKTFAFFMILILTYSANNSWCYFLTICLMATMFTSEKYIERLFALLQGSENYWRTLTNEEKKEKTEKDVNEINKITKKLKNNFEAVTSKKYIDIENKTITYLEHKYNTIIQREIKIINKQNNNRSCYLDGIIKLDNKDIFIEIKYTNNTTIAKEFFKRVFSQLLNTAICSPINKNIELMIIIVVNGIDKSNKCDLEDELNTQLQKELLTYKYSGKVLILTVDEISKQN